jgi:hypothetical protein
MYVTHCLNISEFTAFYFNSFHFCTCFLIIKQLASAEYKVEHFQKDVFILTLNMSESQIQVTNIYFFSLKDKADLHSDSSIHNLHTYLNRSERHVLVEDFNVHNSLWDDLRIRQSHALSHMLTNQFSIHNMKIDISKTLIIFQENRDTSIIDIITIDRNTHHRILKCHIWEEINSGSDHQFVCLTLNIDSSFEIDVSIRKWNKMYSERIQAESEHL